MDDLSIRVYRSLQEVESMRPAWEGLLAEFPGATTFSTWEWLASWWRAFGEGRELLAVAFFDETQGLVGLAPLQISRRRVARLFNLRVLGLWGDGSGDSDNLDIPVRPGYEAQVTAALVEFLQDESGRRDVCEFNTMPSDSAIAGCLRQRLSNRGRTYCGYQTSAAIALPETWQEYLAQLSAKERGKIAYYQNRLLKKYNVRFDRCAGEEIPRRLESLFALHGRRWRLAGERGSFELEARRQFYRELAAALVARDRLEFWLLELDGKAVAAQFGFRHGETVFQLQEGFDPAYSGDSVGYVLRAHVIEQLISRGVRRYDFLAGESPSKARWGARTGQYVSLQFARPYSVGGAYLRMMHGAADGKEWLRGHLPGNAWQALHALNVKMPGSRNGA
jgi:CelD/BcsL family acetyltransferase involved in cellulose biosynthesis